MLTVSESALKSNSPTQVIRYCTRSGLNKLAARQRYGCRLYAYRYATRLRFLRSAKSPGFTFNEIGAIIRRAEKVETTRGELRKVFRRPITENCTKIEEMSKLRARMEHALVKWEKLPGGIPDANSIYHLIGSCAIDCGHESNPTRKSSQP